MWCKDRTNITIISLSSIMPKIKGHTKRLDLSFSVRYIELWSNMRPMLLFSYSNCIVRYYIPKYRRCAIFYNLIVYFTIYLLSLLVSKKNTPMAILSYTYEGKRRSSSSNITNPHCSNQIQPPKTNKFEQYNSQLPFIIATIGQYSTLKCLTKILNYCTP